MTAPKTPGRQLSTCIKCWCDDDHACEGGCAWLRVDNANHVGVCSQCRSALPLWEAGCRQLLIKPKRLQQLMDAEYLATPHIGKKLR